MDNGRGYCIVSDVIYDNDKYLSLILLIASAFIGASIFSASRFGLGTLILSAPVSVELIYTSLESFKGRIKTEQGLKELKKIVSDLKEEKNKDKQI